MAYFKAFGFGKITAADHRRFLPLIQEDGPTPFA
jgi:hypothetical protein